MLKRNKWRCKVEYRRNVTNEKSIEINKRNRILGELKQNSIRGLASSPEGRLFLFFMMNDCGYNASSLVFNEDKGVSRDAVIINETLRNFYLNIRKLIPKELLRDIEFLDIDEYMRTYSKGETNGTN